MEKPEVIGWEVKTNENGVEMAILPRHTMLEMMKYVEYLEMELRGNALKVKPDTGVLDNIIRNRMFKYTLLSPDVLILNGFDVTTLINETTVNYWNKNADASVDVEFVSAPAGTIPSFYYRCLGSKEHRKRITTLEELHHIHHAVKGQHIIKPNITSI